MTLEPEYAKTDVNGNPLSEEERKWARDPDNRHRTEPFSKTNWKTAASRDKWSSLLDRADAAKREAEWRSVLDDRTEREAAIIHVNNHNREKWLKIIGRHGLAYRDIRYTEPYGGYSHKFYPTDKSDPERITYAVIAENEDTADKVEEIELSEGGEDRHNQIGDFLNFPQCCRDFFDEVWLKEERIDPMYEIACNSGNATPIDGDKQNVLIKDPEPWANILYRYFGHAFITHIPCSWDCQESIELGKTRGEIMADNGYKDVANALHNWLSKPMVWTGKNGLAHVRNSDFIGSSGTSCYWRKKRIVWGEEHTAGGEIVEE